MHCIMKHGMFKYKYICDYYLILYRATCYTWFAVTHGVYYRNTGCTISITYAFRSEKTRPFRDIEAKEVTQKYRKGRFLNTNLQYTDTGAKSAPRGTGVDRI